jgi:hypothetical protein
MATQLQQIRACSDRLDDHEQEVFERSVRMNALTDTAQSIDLTIRALRKIAKAPAECDTLGDCRGEVRSIRLCTFRLKGVPTARLEVGPYARWGKEYGQLDATLADHESEQAAHLHLIGLAVKSLQAELRALKAEAKALAEF